MSMRDLVAPDSCGVVNPMANMGNAAAQAAQMGADARAFAGGGMGKQLPGQGMQMDTLQQMRPQDLSMAKDFEAKFAGGHMMPNLDHMGQMAHPMGPQHDPSAMVKQFNQMNLQNQQAMNQQALNQQAGFEALYRHGSQTPNMGQQWAKELPQQMNGMPQNQWAAEFSGQRNMAGRSMPHGPMMNMQGNMPMMGMGMNMMQQPMMMPTMGMPMQQMQMPTQPVIVQKSVTQAETKVETEVESMGGMGMGMDKAMIEKLTKSDDPKWRNSKFLKFIDQINKGEVEFKDNQVVPAVPKQDEAERVAEEWAAEFDTENAGQDVDWQQQFNDMGSEKWLEQYQNDFMDFESARVREQKDPEYAFAENNPYAQEADPYQLGLKLLKEGKLKAAIQAFEMATQKNPDNADAWRYLGSACAENEDEKGAIAALLRCITIDPYNLPALLMLGVSYTNDLEESRALNYLKTWMLHNPEYQGVEQIAGAAQGIEEYEEFYGGTSNGLDGSLHDQVTNMFMEATKVNPNDSDLYTVLGVLWHISNDFEKAIDAFKNAVKIKPDDPALWNKLGATQANSSKSADAVFAYKRALELRPSYVRALANLAISFANQGLHEDATRTYLATLRQNPDADHVWSYLRISLSNLDRRELVQLTDKRDVELFRPHFKF